MEAAAIRGGLLGDGEAGQMRGEDGGRGKGGKGVEWCARGGRGLRWVGEVAYLKMPGQIQPGVRLRHPERQSDACPALPAKGNV